MSPVASLGSVLDSHNPQRLEISERASAARGAMQRLGAESKPAESESAAEMIFNPLHLCPRKQVCTGTVTVSPPDGCQLSHLSFPTVYHKLIY